MSFTLNYSKGAASQQDLAQVAEQLLPYQDEVSKIQLIQKGTRANGSYPSLILVGIGGSSLGARALISALRPDMSILHLESIDTGALEKAVSTVQDGKQVIVVSKSGSTLETMVNLGILLPYLKECIIVADKDTPLAQFAKDKGFTHIVSPKEISGRFSLFTAVGLVPIAGAGISTEKLLEGAEKMRKACLGSDVMMNPALLGAARAYLHLQQGKSLHAFFSLDQRLNALSIWWRQLMAESSGKDGKGITPLVSDVSDLHSMFQRYAQGPKDVMTTFLSADQVSSLKLPEDFPLAPELEGKNVGDISQGIIQGVLRAYDSLKLPYMHVHFETLNEDTLGAFCMWKMMETIYLAKLMEINPFGQPGVESYKREVKKIFHM
jgi:glucose-6-phosphate isomerase